MKLYYISGKDNLYQGLHGMQDSRIVLCDDDDEAIEWAKELSYDVMESYSNIYEDLEERVVERCAEECVYYKDDGSEVDRIREEVYDEDLNYEVDLLNSNWLPTEDIDELDDLLWEIGDEEFRSRYSLRSI